MRFGRPVIPRATKLLDWLAVSDFRPSDGEGSHHPTTTAEAHAILRNLRDGARSGSGR